MDIAVRPREVTSRAWLDHEWSSEYMAAGAVGWDWIGIKVYWEGAVRVLAEGRLVVRGYLELTGYGGALRI